MPNKKVKIKICGLTDPKEAAYLNRSAADFAGFVLFCPKSKRNISLTQAEAIAKKLDPKIKKVAVCIAPDITQIRQMESSAAKFDFIQIHGALDFCLLDQIHLPVFKAFAANDLESVDAYRSCEKIAGFLFDAPSPGSGKSFDWNTLTDIPREKTFLLAGGLSADNVESAIKSVHPDVVDVSSGVEFTQKKGKDPDKIDAFVRAVNRCFFSRDMVSSV